MATYETDIKLGTRYRDQQTGLEGTAVCIEFHQHSCERVLLETVKDEALTIYIFDAARLVTLEPEKPQAAPVRTGGALAAPVSNRR